MSAFGGKRTSPANVVMSACTQSGHWACPFHSPAPAARSVRWTDLSVGPHERRKFITLLGGAAVAWPIAARAQQSERMRRIGVLVAATAEDPDYQARIAAFQQGLEQLGWSDGRNVHIDTRWATTKPDESQARGRISCARAGRHPGWYWHRNSGAVATGDPHRADRVRDSHRPGRRRLRRQPGAARRQRDWVHGFRIRHEREMAGAAEADRAPVTRAAVLRDPTIASGIGQFAAVQAVAPSLGVD